MKEYIIDAKNKRLGKVATEAAKALMGKELPNFKRNMLSSVRVSIRNANDLDISEARMEKKEYVRHSGFPGGQKIDTLKSLIEKKGIAEVIRKAVYGMLPTNKLRPRMMKNLIIE
jgi:large subunit ribosomal protein L13